MPGNGGAENAGAGVGGILRVTVPSSNGPNATLCENIRAEGTLWEVSAKKDVLRSDRTMFVGYFRGSKAGRQERSEYLERAPFRPAGPSCHALSKRGLVLRGRPPNGSRGPRGSVVWAKAVRLVSPRGQTDLPPKADDSAIQMEAQPRRNEKRSRRLNGGVLCRPSPGRGGARFARPAVMARLTGSGGRRSGGPGAHGGEA